MYIQYNQKLIYKQNNTFYCSINCKKVFFLLHRNILYVIQNSRDNRPIIPSHSVEGGTPLVKSSTKLHCVARLYRVELRPYAWRRLHNPSPAEDVILCTQSIDDAVYITMHAVSKRHRYFHDIFRESLRNVSWALEVVNESPRYDCDLNHIEWTSWNMHLGKHFLENKKHNPRRWLMR